MQKKVTMLSFLTKTKYNITNLKKSLVVPYSDVKPA